jgi:hypothetical protein
MTIGKNWRDEYLNLMGSRLSLFQVELLKEGPKKLTDAWALGAMKNDWKRKINK